MKNRGTITQLLPGGKGGAVYALERSSFTIRPLTFWAAVDYDKGVIQEITGIVLEGGRLLFADEVKGFIGYCTSRLDGEKLFNEYRERKKLSKGNG